MIITIIQVVVMIIMFIITIIIVIIIISIAISFIIICSGECTSTYQDFDVHKGYRVLTHSRTMLPKVADKLPRQFKWLHFPDVS